MADWSQTPKELMVSIAERLNLIEDYVRFGGVCQSWRSVTVDQRDNFHYSPKTLPWLMFPLCEKDKDERYNDIDNPNFFSLSENKFYKANRPKVLNCHLSGSAYGWLITFRGEKVEIINPLSCVHVPLPPFSTFEDYPLSLFGHTKAVLATPSYSSVKPTEEQFVVVVSFAGKLAFARPQDTSWTTVKIPSTGIEDILQLNDQFYAVDAEGAITQFDISSPNPIATEIASPPVGINSPDCNFYLVELCGELHLVLKYHCMRRLSESHHLEPGSRPFLHSQMMHFMVHKLDLHTRKWKKVLDLRDHAIFIGHNTSFSLLASDYPNIRASSIYFTDPCMGEQQSTGNIGVFNLKTQGLRILFTGDDVVSLYSTPVWVIPKLC